MSPRALQGKASKLGPKMADFDKSSLLPTRRFYLVSQNSIGRLVGNNYTTHAFPYVFQRPWVYQSQRRGLIRRQR